MASIEKLLGHSTEEIEAMSLEELMAKFGPVFDLERKLIDEGALQVIKDEPEDEPDETPEGVESEAAPIRTKKKSTTKTAAEKAKEKMDAIKAQLMALENITKETT